MAVPITKTYLMTIRRASPQQHIARRGERLSVRTCISLRRMIKLTASRTVCALVSVAATTASLDLLAQAWTVDPALQAEVKAHRVKQLSDREIRELHSRAAEISKDEARQIRAEEDQFWRERREMQEKCKDVVFRTRNERACFGAHSTMYMFSRREPRSQEQVFDSLLTAGCDLVRADRRALARANCLPKN